jgi:hypothetical protein
VDDGIYLCSAHIEDFSITQDCHPLGAKSVVVGRGFNIRPLHRLGLSKLLAMVEKAGWQRDIGTLHCTFVTNGKQVKLAVYAGMFTIYYYFT